MIPYVRKILRVRFKFQIKKWITLIRQRKINLDNNAVLVVGGHASMRCRLSVSTKKSGC